MAKIPKPAKFGIPAPRELTARVLTQAEEDQRRRRANAAMLTSPFANKIAEAIVDLWDGSTPVALETETHHLQVTVTPK